MEKSEAATYIQGGHISPQQPLVSSPMNHATSPTPHRSSVDRAMAEAPHMNGLHVASETYNAIARESPSLELPHSLSGRPPSYVSGVVPQQILPVNAPFHAAELANDGKKHLLLAASGSVATIKIPNILRALSTHPALSIRVILTASAMQFLSGVSAEQPTVASLLSIPNVDAVYTDHDEWEPPWTRGASILHIELRKWSDILVIAPLSANTLAKMVHGISDNLLTSVLRAWDTDGSLEPPNRPKRIKRVVVAPAMNTAMWLHPITASQIKVLEEEWGVSREFVSKGKRKGEGWVEVIRPGEKELACGQ